MRGINQLGDREPTDWARASHREVGDGEAGASHRVEWRAVQEFRAVVQRPLADNQGARVYRIDAGADIAAHARYVGAAVGADAGRCPGYPARNQRLVVEIKAD